MSRCCCGSAGGRLRYRIASSTPTPFQERLAANNFVDQNGKPVSVLARSLDDPVDSARVIILQSAAQSIRQQRAGEVPAKGVLPFGQHPHQLERPAERFSARQGAGSIDGADPFPSRAIGQFRRNSPIQIPRDPSLCGKPSISSSAGGWPAAPARTPSGWLYGRGQFRDIGGRGRRRTPQKSFEDPFAPFDRRGPRRLRRQRENARLSQHARPRIAFQRNEPEFVPFNPRDRRRAWPAARLETCTSRSSSSRMLRSSWTIDSKKSSVSRRMSSPQIAVEIFENAPARPGRVELRQIQPLHGEIVDEGPRLLVVAASAAPGPRARRAFAVSHRTPAGTARRPACCSTGNTRVAKPIRTH